MHPSRLLTATALVIAASLSFLLPACGESSTSSATVSAISISPSPCAVTRTNSVQLTATATLNDGTKEDLSGNPAATWATGDMNTATVSANGVLVGVSTGVTKITVTFEGATGEEDCTVAP
jgi:hypothetical protein